MPQRATMLKNARTAYGPVTCSSRIGVLNPSGRDRAVTNPHSSGLSYEVTMELEDLSLAASLERYMTDQHVAEVLATGCFVDGRFEQSGPGIYRTRYSVESQENLDRYVAEHAPRLRADFQQHFPAGLRVSRAVWKEVS